MLKDLIEEYLQTLADVQSSGFERTPYILEIRRIDLHQKIADFLGEDTYFKLKDIFSNLDKVCSLYSDCNEWELKDDFDVSRMSEYLVKYLASDECQMYLEGKLDLPAHRRK